MKVVLMAGGRGTRISELFPDVPKPLIPIQNMPVLEREIISLREQGFTEIILTVGYMADKIKDYFGDGSRLGVKINYFVEDKPLGNAGALFFLDLIEDFLLLNADAIFDVDFNRMVKYHRRKGALVTLFTHPNSHPYDSGLIIADKSGEVKQWLTKEESRPKYYKNRVERFEYSNVLKYNSNYNNSTTTKRGRNIFYKLLYIYPVLAFGVMGKNPQNSFLRKVCSKIRSAIGD